MTSTKLPVPTSATVCGDALALSVIVSMPVRLPATIGVKVTEIVQFPPAVKLDPQVLVSAKSPEPVIEVIERPAVPEFVNVTV